MKSIIGLINSNDLVKGAIVVIITAILTAILKGLQTQTIQFTWLYFAPIVYSALTAGIAYILKNWLSNSEGKFLKAEPKPNEVSKV